MASDKQYRAVHGIVQFPPKDGEAGGKTVRNIVVREVGFKEQSVRVYATVWPSHKDVALAEGDVVTIEGSYTRNTSTSDEGEARVFHNLSVTRILNHGASDSGTKVETENTPDPDEPSDDEIPF